MDEQATVIRLTQENENLRRENKQLKRNLIVVTQACEVSQERVRILEKLLDDIGGSLKELRQGLDKL